MSRKVFAAAHVAAVAGPGGAPVIDWESTLRFREHLWAHGFGVAEAMDTAQRRVERLAEPVQDDRAGGLGEQLAVHVQVVPGAAGPGGQRAAGHQDHLRAG